MRNIRRSSAAKQCAKRGWLASRLRCRPTQPARSPRRIAACNCHSIAAASANSTMRREVRQFGKLRGTETPYPGDNLEAVTVGPHRDELNESMLPDALGKLLQLRLLEGPGIVHQRIQAGWPQRDVRHEWMHRTLKENITNPPAASLRAQQCHFTVELVGSHPAVPTI